MRFVRSLVCALALGCGSSSVSPSASPSSSSEPTPPDTETVGSAAERDESVACIGRGPFEPSPAPAGALRRLGSGRLRESGAALDLAFVGDCAVAVATLFDVRVWDLDTASERWAVEHGPHGGGLGVSPDGASVVSGNADEVVLYDAADGSVRWRRALRWGGMGDALFSADGNYVVVGGETEYRGHVPLHVLDASDGSVVHELAAEGKDVGQLALAGDTVLVGSSFGEIARLDVVSGELGPFADPRDGGSSRPLLSDLLALPDGSALLVFSRETFRVSPDGEVERVADGASSATALAGGRWVRASRTMTLEPGSEPFAPTSQVHHLAASADGRWLAGFVYSEQRVAVWSVESGERWLPPSDGHETSVGHLRWTADGLVSVDAGDTVIAWDLAEASARTRVEVPSVFALHPDGRVATSRGSYGADGERIQRWSLDTATIGSGDWRSGWVVRLGEENLHLWREGRSMEEHVIDTEDRWQVAVLHDDAVHACALGGIVARFALDGDSPQWRLDLGERPTDACYALAVSDDGGRLVAGHFGGITVIDTRRGRALRTLAEPGTGTWPRPHPAALAIAGDRVAVAWSWLQASEPRVTVHSLADGAIQCSFGRAGTPHRQRGRTMALAFSPDGRSLATGGMDGTIAIWDVADCGD